jgi:hypothetical protein
VGPSRPYIRERRAAPIRKLYPPALEAAGAGKEEDDAEADALEVGADVEDGDGGAGDGAELEGGGEGEGSMAGGQAGEAHPADTIPASAGRKLSYPLWGLRRNYKKKDHEDTMRIIFQAGTDADSQRHSPKYADVSAPALRLQLAGFRNELRDALSGLNAQVSDYRISQLDVNVGFLADGSVGLMGVGAHGGSEAGLTMQLSLRPVSDAEDPTLQGLFGSSDARDAV